MNKLFDFAKTLKVLYVEDNEEARESTVALLSNIFNNIETGVDGKDGLEKFKKQKFDLVITDILMPRMNGLEMIEEIKKIDKNIPIIIISAYNGNDYLLKSIKLGVRGYLLKPIDISQFIEVMNATINYLYKKEILKNKIEEKLKFLDKVVRENSLLFYYYPIINGNEKMYECRAEVVYKTFIKDVNSFFKPVIDSIKYREITKLLIKECIEKCKRSSNTKFFINLSLYDLKDDSIIDFIKEELKNINANQIGFDIDIEEFEENIDLLKLFINLTKSLNANIVIYNVNLKNLDTVLKLNPDYIKIDSNASDIEEFVKRVEEKSIKVICKCACFGNHYNQIKKLPIDYIQMGYKWGGVVKNDNFK